MKRLLLIILMGVAAIAQAQEPPPPRMGRMQGAPPPPPPGERPNIEAIKVAYITKQLNLSAEEAQKFWPAYNACFEELKKARQEKNEDILAFEEAALNIRKKYKNDFKKALGSDERVNKAMGADRAFMSMIKDELQNRKGGKPGSKKKGNGAPPPPPPPGQEEPTI